MSFAFHPEAELEFNEAIEYYERIEPGLGLQFADEVYQAIDRAVAWPLAWQVIEGNVRRSLVRRFPYGVLYGVLGEGIVIVAVMNLHRQPGYWQHRA